MANPFDYAQPVSHGNYGTAPSYAAPTQSSPFHSYNFGNYGTPYGGGYNPDAGAATFGQSNPLSNPYARASFYSYNPQAAFGAFESSLPGGVTNPYSRYLQNNYYRYYGGYQGDLANNPYQSFQDYLQRMNPQFQTEFSNLSPVQRGESPQIVGRTQYVGF